MRQNELPSGVYTQTYEINKATTTKRLHKWGLKLLITIVEFAYPKY